MIDLHERLRKELADRYVIERELGSGGMSTVYLAQDLKHHRQVAIKVLRPEVAGVIGAARFLREIQIAAQLSHPRIVPLYDSGQADGLLYYVMPFVDGESLRSRLDKDGIVPLDEAVKLTQSVSSALAHAHVHNVIHRDIKPENILLSGGEVVVADFGIARAISAAGGEAVSQADIPIGTVGYMSPEQAMGSRDLDGRTDQYSLACVLYEMLVGHPPGIWFDEIRAEAMGEERVAEWQVALESAAPHEICSVLVKALALYPSDRYESVEQFARSLGQGEVRVSDPAAPVATRRRRFSTGVLTGAVMAIVLIGGTLGMWLSGGEPRPDEYPRVAVMPFENRDSVGDEYLTEGVAAAIRSRLAGLSGLAVLAFYRPDDYWAASRSVGEVGAELGANYLLRGSVRRGAMPDGSQVVRVSPELVRVADATIVWADSYDAPPEGIFKLQVSIAEQVARALDVVVLGPEREKLEEQPTGNPEAWAYYVRGEHFYQRSSMLEDNRRALSMFEQAVAVDSSFSLGWARLASAHMAVYATGEAAPEHLDLAKEAAKRAMELNPELPAATSAQIGIHFASREYDQGRALAKRFMARNPGGDYNVLYLLAHIERRLGNWDAAIASFEKASELDRARRPPLLTLAEIYTRTGDYANAERYLDKALTLGPDMADAWVQKAWLRLVSSGDVGGAQGLLDEAAGLCGGLAIVRELVTLEPHQPMLALLGGDVRRILLESGPEDIGFPGSHHLAMAIAHGAAEEWEVARAHYDSLASDARAMVVSEPDMAIWHALLGIALASLGERDEAVLEAERALELSPVADDVWEGTDILQLAAQVLVVARDYDAAIEHLEALTEMPSRYSTTWLGLHPVWEPLRDHARFQRMVGRR